LYFEIDIDMTKRKGRAVYPAFKSKASWPRGPGFDFTPEGWCLSLDTRWNDGMVEKWNNGYEKWMMA
jgi:hypothetical protein